jgi:thiol-disulfide isomerase/thioredoxin/plastocyanin
MRTSVFVLFALLLGNSYAFGQAVAAQAGATKPARPAIFDPARDAAKDLQDGIAEASRSGKRVLVDVGGNWCGWCHEMERFIEAHAELKALRDKYFVTVKVNYSSENENAAVLSKFPKIDGYPHLFVLDKDGSLLRSQDTSLLEDGKSSYVLEKFKDFLVQWSGQQGPGQAARPAGPQARTAAAADYRVTIALVGMDPFSIEVPVGSRVTFVNKDARFPHDMTSDCPEFDAIGRLAPGSSGQTAIFTGPKTCAYHDRLQPDSPLRRGRVVIR